MWLEKSNRVGFDILVNRVANCAVCQAEGPQEDVIRCGVGSVNDASLSACMIENECEDGVEDVRVAASVESGHDVGFVTILN